MSEVSERILMDLCKKAYDDTMNAIERTAMLIDDPNQRINICLSVGVGLISMIYRRALEQNKNVAKILREDLMQMIGAALDGAAEMDEKKQSGFFAIRISRKNDKVTASGKVVNEG